MISPPPTTTWLTLTLLAGEEEEEMFWSLTSRLADSTSTEALPLYEDRLKVRS